MEKSVLIAGSGGHGIQVVGITLAKAIDKEGRKVTYSPKYGIEKRGGLSSCYLVISDDIIGNPRKGKFDIVIVMDSKTYRNFHNELNTEGLLIVNSSLVKEQNPLPVGCKRMDVPILDIAIEAGNTRVVSSVILGLLAGVLDVFKNPESLKIEMLENLKSKPNLLEINNKAFNLGFEYSNNV